MNACSVFGFWSHLQIMARPSIFVATCSLSSTLCNASLPTAASASASASAPPRPSPHAPPRISGLPTLTSQPPPWRGAWGRRAAALGGGALVSQAALHTLFCGFHPTATKCLATASVKGKSIHDFTVKDISGKSVDLSIFKGKLLLVVNVASQCGLTAGNYAELSDLHKKYRDEGFEILAFPCNQFGGQEPGTNEQIKEFACSRYKAEFPIFDKVDVNGPSTAPVYAFLKASKGGLLGDNIKWNFGKFLVDKNGQVVERYAPTTSPLQIESDIKKLLFAK